MSPVLALVLAAVAAAPSPPPVAPAPAAQATRPTSQVPAQAAGQPGGRPAPAADPADHGAYFDLGRGGPVEWRPWGEAAFREAAERGLPVLVDVGAIWCHYCRVMNDRTYADPATAAILNRSFVPVRVDRDREPQADARFQAAMARIRKTGGWPLTGFLTDSGRIFSGGAYFPADDRPDGTPGLRTAIERVADDYQVQKVGYHNVAEDAASLLISDSLGDARPGKVADTPTAVLEAMAARADRTHGGFGTGAKFPDWPALLLALDRAAEGDDRMRLLALATLDGMASGGIRDLLGGGFHRIALDRAWKTPRFEKLLAINAGLVEAYARAAVQTDEERYRRVAGEALDYLLGNLTDPAGGFYAAQAADAGPDDNGSYYTWTLAQVGQALDGEAERLAIEFFGLKADPGSIEGAPAANVLAVAGDLAGAARRAGVAPERAREVLVGAIAGLRKARAERPAPPVDRRLYAAPNALAAHALLVAAPLLDRPDARDQALRAIDRFLASAWAKGQGVRRGIGPGGAFGDGLLLDQAAFTLALLDAYEATGQRRYLDAALDSGGAIFSRFGEKSAGGLYDVAAGSPEFSMLFVPLRPVRDGAEPGANALAALGAARLHRLTGDPLWGERARRVIEAFAGLAGEAGPAAATLARAARELLDPPAVAYVGCVAGGSAAEADGLARVAARAPGTALVRCALPGAVPAAALSAEARASLLRSPRLAVTVVRKGRLAGLATSPEALAALLKPPAPRPDAGKPAPATPDGAGQERKN